MNYLSEIPGNEYMDVVLSDVEDERTRQNQRWGNHHTLSSKDWLPILVEEVGEVPRLCLAQVKTT